MTDYAEADYVILGPPKIHVIGPFTVTDRHGERSHLSSAIAQVVAVLVAAGPDGLTKDALAAQLWDPSSLPSSWKSATRNRITRARSALGHEAVVTVSNRYRLGDTVKLESLGLLEASSWLDADHGAGFDWLKGVPLAGIAASSRITDFRDAIASARALRIREIVDSSALTLSPRQLEALRRYTSDSTFDPGVTADVVGAHMRVGELISARKIIDDAYSSALKSGTSASWIDALARRFGADSGHTDVAGVTQAQVSSTQRERAASVSEKRRTELFWAAARDEQWTMAYEIAVEGVTQTASASGGGSDRWPLQTAIPLERLDRARQLRLAATLTWQMRVIEPAQALQWSRLARQLARLRTKRVLPMSRQHSLATLSMNERYLPCPQRWSTRASTPPICRVTRVVLTNRLERSSWHDVAPIARRFHELVEASPEPYRRWHGMNLQGMQSFVDGDWDAALRQAKQSYDYGEFSGLAEAGLAWNCHLVNQRWVFDRIATPAAHAYFQSGKQTTIERGLTSLASGDSDVVECFLDSFGFESRMTFAVPLLVALAANTNSTSLRRSLYQRLLTRSGTSAIFGAGMMHLGPVDRMCARLAETADEKRTHLEAAIKVADDQQTRLWQVICRSELGALFEEPQFVSEAHELATTPVLRGLVDVASGGA